MKNALPLLLASLFLTSCAFLPKSEDRESTEEAEVTETVEITEDSDITEESDPTPDPEPESDPIESADRPNPVAAFFQNLFPKKEAVAETPAAVSPNWIGSIKAINERDDWVLIDSQPYQGLPTGTVLTSVGADNETGSVRVSDDRNPPFFVADVVSGRPGPGDRVYDPSR
ncbi:MAG: hypothetical protein WA771_09905 [Chthoniobacterales bacterium]